ncbi:hypothetical protein ACIBL8_26725 [Streptomyces sp. NPDC050523]|uniref:hypothetical protein n=1 Tax=Streptomyces sp. NPDC050523 TaxID=3365622 RepID=UPI0037B9C36A
MTPRTTKKHALRVSETGRAKSRHLHEKGIRTCAAPAEGHSAAPAAHTGAEWNIVRGED